MKKSFKLALIGCASSCLMSTVYANAQPIDLLTGLEISGLSVEDMVCGAEARDYDFTITNKSFSKVFLGPLVISLGDDDSFPENSEAVTVDRGSCGFRLGRFEKCEGTVTFDPTKLSCAKQDHPLVFDADIDRELIAVYTKIEDEAKKKLFPRIATADIDVDVNLLGSLTDYSITADNIIAGTDDDEPHVMDSITSVEGNVSAADNITDVDDIFFNCEYNTCGVVEFEEDQAAAFKDAAQVWSVFRNAIFDGGSTLTCDDADYTIDLAGDYVEVYPGIVYCVEYDIAINGASGTPVAPYDTAVYGITGEIAFKGDEDDVFVFVFPDVPTYNDGVSINTIWNLTLTDFGILPGAKFSLTSDALGTTVDNRNIFWVLPENSTTEFAKDSRFAGNIITAGDVGFCDATINLQCESMLAGAAPYIMGGIYALSEDIDIAQESCPETTVTTHGFTIDSDSNDE